MCCWMLCSREWPLINFYDFFPQLLKENEEYVAVVSFDTPVNFRNLQRWVNIFYWALYLTLLSTFTKIIMISFT